MNAIITFFILTLALAIIIPTLPNSRRIRLALAVIAVPVVIIGYNMVEARASYYGATQMDYFIEHSQRLLKEGKTNLLLAAYQDYQEQHGSVIPKAAAPAYRAWLLNHLITEKEIEFRQDGIK